MGYDSFGKGGPSNGYAFTGREFDPETGLLYYRARYYDPKIGRFISEDPSGLVGGLNLYRYVRNNPVTLTDPEGLAPASPPNGLVAGALALNYAFYQFLSSQSYKYFPGDDQDRERHCWVNCVATRTMPYFPLSPVIASAYKEVQDLGRGGTWDDSKKDLAADVHGMTCAYNPTAWCSTQCASTPTRRGGRREDH